MQRLDATRSYLIHRNIDEPTFFFLIFLSFFYLFNFDRPRVYKYRLAKKPAQNVVRNEMHIAYWNLDLFMCFMETSLQSINVSMTKEAIAFEGF